MNEEGGFGACEGTDVPGKRYSLREAGKMFPADFILTVFCSVA